MWRKKTVKKKKEERNTLHLTLCLGFYVKVGEQSFDTDLIFVFLYLFR